MRISIKHADGHAVVDAEGTPEECAAFFDAVRKPKRELPTLTKGDIALSIADALKHAKRLGYVS